MAPSLLDGCRAPPRRTQYVASPLVQRCRLRPHRRQEQGRQHRQLGTDRAGHEPHVADAEQVEAHPVPDRAASEHAGQARRSRGRASSVPSARERRGRRRGWPAPRGRRPRSRESCRPRDPGAAEHLVAVVQHRRLTRRRRPDRLRGLDRQPIVADERHLAGDRLGPVADANRGREPVRGRLAGDEVAARRDERPARDLVAPTDDNGVRRRHDLSDVDGLAQREPEPVPLAHGVVRVAGVRADLGPVGVDDETRLAVVAAPLGQQRAVIAERDEADLLALRLRGGGQRELGRDRAHLGLRQLPERKARRRQLRLGERPEEVGLVLRDVARAQQVVPAAGIGRDPCVVPGGDRVGTVGREAALEEHVELDVLVARLARVRGGAVEVAVDEGVDDLRAELTLEVEDEERDAGQLRHPARIVGRVRRAAAATQLVALALVRGEAHPDAHHVRTAVTPLGGKERGRHARVDAPAHGGHDAAAHALTTEAGTPPRRRATIAGRIAAARSISSLVVVGPIVIRSDPWATCGSIHRS